MDSMEEMYDLCTISRDNLLILLRASRDEIVKYTHCSKTLEGCEKRIEKEQNIINENSRGCLPIGIAIFIICAVIVSYYIIFDPKSNSAFSGICSLLGIITLIVTPFAHVSQKRDIKNAHSNIAKLKAQLSVFQKEKEAATNEIAAAWIIPEEYRYEYALTTMLEFVKNKRASNWERVTDLYEEHLHRMTVEESAQITAENSKLQAEYARQTRNASRMAAAGAWASAAGIWRINSKL